MGPWGAVSVSPRRLSRYGATVDHITMPLVESDVTAVAVELLPAAKSSSPVIVRVWPGDRSPSVFSSA